MRRRLRPPLCGSNTLALLFVNFLWGRGAVFEKSSLDHLVVDEEILSGCVPGSFVATSHKEDATIARGITLEGGRLAAVGKWRAYSRRRLCCRGNHGAWDYAGGLDWQRWAMLPSKGRMAFLTRMPKI